MSAMHTEGLPMFAHARTTDPQTSHMAAASVGKVQELQDRLVDMFGAGPMTDLHLVRVYNLLSDTTPSYPPATPQNLRSRRAELVKQGKVHDTKQREIGPSGRKFVVWGLTK